MIKIDKVYTKGGDKGKTSLGNGIKDLIKGFTMIRNTKYGNV